MHCFDDQMALSCWMGLLSPELTRLPLCKLRIPGSHDSGADPSLDYKLPVANDEGKTIATLGTLRFVRKGIRRWAITQRLSVLEQLHSGIRYFDLRVSRPPEQLRNRIGEFHLVHALYGPAFKEFLAELRQFLDEHPTEVVLLDINHVFGMGLHPQNKLKELIGETLGWGRLCPPMEMEQCTLDYMRSEGFQVIVFMCMSESGPFWCQDAIVSRWPETNKVGKLIPFLQQNLEEDRPAVMNRFYVHQGVLTAKTVDVILRWPSTLEKSLSVPATNSVSVWLSSLTPSQQSDVNIVMVDFVDSAFCSSVIQLNYSVV